MRLVISDADAGLRAAITKCFAGASWQRCRSTSSATCWPVPKAHAEFAAASRSIFALGTPEAVQTRYDEVTHTLEDRFARATEVLAGARTDVLAFTAFPCGQCRNADLVHEPARTARR